MMALDSLVLAAVFSAGLVLSWLRPAVCKAAADAY